MKLSQASRRIRLNTALGEDALGVVDGAADEARSLGNSVGMAGVEVVQHDDVVPGLEQLGGHHRPDVAGSTGDEKLQTTTACAVSMVTGG